MYIWDKCSSSVQLKHKYFDHKKELRRLAFEQSHEKRRSESLLCDTCSCQSLDCHSWWPTMRTFPQARTLLKGRAQMAKRNRKAFVILQNKSRNVIILTSQTKKYLKLICQLLALEQLSFRKDTS